MTNDAPPAAITERMKMEHVRARMEQRLKATSYYDKDGTQRRNSTFVVEVDDVVALLAAEARLTKEKDAWQESAKANIELALKNHDEATTKLISLDRRALTAEARLAEANKALDQARHWITCSGARHPGGIIQILTDALAAKPAPSYPGLPEGAGFPGRKI